MNRITKEQATAFRKRWTLVNDAEIAELLQTPMDEKLQQTAALMATVQAMDWDNAMAPDEVEVWSRWQQLRTKLQK